MKLKTARMRLSLDSIFRPFRARPARSCAGAEGVDFNDLLGRRPVNLDTTQLQRFLAGKRVLVTGAGGSIGSEICRQTLKFLPDKLVLLDRGENALFEIDRELRQRWVGADLRPYVADIADATRIEQIFQTEQPQVVFHAGAHKHVPMMEQNPGEAIKVNVFGTKTVADAALACGASAFVMISTDKAVNPTSVMGASKRVAELYVQSLNAERCQLPVVSGQKERRAGNLHLTTSNSPGTRFVAVRFGNVLGSNGSVVPIFLNQIATGGPVTVTHPEMRRYFMTIPEASQLVMQAGAIGRGGEIFVLDMGEQVRILDLANELIRRAGLKVGRDIEIAYTGVRPGEKLFEELACDTEQTRPTAHAKIHVWQLATPSPVEVDTMLTNLKKVVNASRDDVVEALCQAVPEFRPDGFERIPAEVQLKLVRAA